MLKLVLRTYWLPCFLVLVILGCLLNAYSFGRDAFSRGQYKTARVWYLISGNIGNPKAQNNLAGMYAEGRGGVRSDTLAVKWYRRAADNGLAQAQFNLSNFYEEGRGVALDTRMAASLLEKAALQGDVEAAFNLGSLYATGRSDLAKDAQKALSWYEKAASFGYASANTT
jgi:uncharacterized protein